MKSRLSVFLLGAAMFGLTACSVEDNPVVGPDNPDIPSWEEPDYDAVKCDVPVFVSGSIKPEVRLALESYLTNITSLDNAQVAVVKGEDIGTYEGKLMDLYNRGGLVVVARPTGEHYQDFADKYGIFEAMPFDTSQPVLLFATDKSGVSVALYDSPPFDGSYDSEDEEDAEPVTEEEEVIPQPADPEKHYRGVIFHFFRWLKQLRESRAAQTRSVTKFVTQFDPTVLITEFTTHTQIFSVAMEHKVYQIPKCSGDYLNKTGVFEVTYSVKPCYVFEACGDAAGDYYIVKCDVTAHNGMVYDPYYTTHGWHGILGTVMVAGYYMRELRFDATLMTDAKTPAALNGLTFAVEPTPSTTINSGSYTTGMELGLNGALSVGMAGINTSMGFSAAYQKSSTIDITDLNIEKYTDEKTRQVSYNYIVQNIGLGRADMFLNAFNTMSVGDIVKKYFPTKIPAIARSDFNATSWWCWKVPANTNAVKDKAETKFCIKTNLGLTHDSYAYWNTPLSSHKSFDYDDNTSTFTIPAPNRQPFGVLSLRNGYTRPIGNIRIYLQDGSSDEIYQLSDIYMSGSLAKCALPVGTYIVDYDQLDSRDNHVISSYRISNVVISNGSNESSSTKEISTANATQIKD